MSMSVLMMFNEGLNNFIGEVGQKPEKVIMPTKWFKEFQADIKEELSIFGNEIVIQFDAWMQPYYKEIRLEFDDEINGFIWVQGEQQ